MRSLKLLVAALWWLGCPRPAPVAEPDAGPKLAVPQPSAVPSTPRDACVASTDCVISRFAGCCTRCQKPPHARAKAAVERDEKACRAVDCARQPEHCPPVEPLSPDVVAACLDGFCTLVEQRCDATKKPTTPPVTADTPAQCKAAGGTWEGGAAKGFAGCRAVGRGRIECQGCTQLPTTDSGKSCRFDWDCEGACGDDGKCSAKHERSDLGCRARCVDGHVKVLCQD